jgi:hypothetical protein
MKILSLISVSFITGSLAGLFAESPIWLQFPAVTLCALSAIWLYRVLVSPSKLSLVYGGIGGLLSGILGGVFGTIMNTFSGNILVLIAAGTLAYNKAYSFIGESLLHNLALYSILGLVGGVAGALSVKKIIGLQKHVTDSIQNQARLSIGLRLLFGALGLVAGIIIGVVVPVYPAFTTILSLRKVGDYPLYVMSYKNDYRFDDFIKTGIKADALKHMQQRDKQPLACTCFAAINSSGHPRFGRNFDWTSGVALLMFSSPPADTRQYPWCI